MKVLVTGVAGQLGHDVMNELANAAIKALALISKKYTAAFLTERLWKPCLMYKWISQTAPVWKKFCENKA